MNNSIVTNLKKITTRLMLFVSTFLISMVTFAQETKAVDININTKGDGNFFANPIVWVVGGAVFILLLVALMRSNNKNV